MALTTTGTQPKIEYPSTDGEPMAQNTKQYRWITTIQGGLAAMCSSQATCSGILSKATTRLAPPPM
jgi:hypothetical protein